MNDLRFYVLSNIILVIPVSGQWVGGIKYGFIILYWGDFLWRERDLKIKYELSNKNYFAITRTL